MKKIITGTLTVALTVAMALIFTACASRPVVEIKPFDTSISFEGSYNEAWSKLIAFLSTNDIGIANLEKASGLIILKGDNLGVQTIQKYCDAQAPFLYTLIYGKASGSIIMTEDSGFVTATVNTKFESTSRGTGTSPNRTAPCRSSGLFETAVLGSIQ